MLHTYSAYILYIHVHMLYTHVYNAAHAVHSTHTKYANIAKSPHQTGKATIIRSTAVQKTGVSQYHGRSIEGPIEVSQTSEHYGIEGFKGGPQLGTIMPIKVRLGQPR